jgi:O-antigen ligase
MLSSELARHQPVISHSSRYVGASPDSSIVIRLHLGGVVLALYLTLPFYKAALQPYLPVDITAVLGLFSAILAIPAVLPALARNDLQYRRQRQFIVLWFGFFLLIWLGTLFAPDQGMAMKHALTLSATVMMPLLLVLRVASNESGLSQFLGTIFLVGLSTTIIVGASGLVEFDSLYRTSFFGSSPINTAISALMVPAIGFTYLWSKARLLRLVILFATPVSVIIAFTSARGPLVTLAAALALLLMLRSFKSLPRMLVYLIGVTLVVAAFDAFIVERLPTFGLMRFQGLSESIVHILAGDRSDIDDASVGVRLDLYDVALDMFSRSPIVGGGTGSFPFETSTIPGLSELDYPHNIVLQFVAEYGLLGLAIFVCLTVSACRVVRGISRPVIFGLSTIYFAALFEAMISGGLENRLFWGLTFLAIALPIDSYRTEESQSGLPGVAG